MTECLLYVSSEWVLGFKRNKSAILSHRDRETERHQRIEFFTKCQKRRDKSDAICFRQRHGEVCGKSERRNHSGLDGWEGG